MRLSTPPGLEMCEALDIGDDDENDSEEYRAENVEAIFCGRACQLENESDVDGHELRVSQAVADAEAVECEARSTSWDAPAPRETAVQDLSRH